MHACMHAMFHRIASHRIAIQSHLHIIKLNHSTTQLRKLIWGACVRSYVRAFVRHLPQDKDKGLCLVLSRCFVLFCSRHAMPCHAMAFASGVESSRVDSVTRHARDKTRSLKGTQPDFPSRRSTIRIRIRLRLRLHLARASC